jgi:hypothetical protein
VCAGLDRDDNLPIGTFQDERLVIGAAGHREKKGKTHQAEPAREEVGKG